MTMLRLALFLSSALVACGGSELNLNEHHSASTANGAAAPGQTEETTDAAPPGLRAVPSSLSYSATVDRLATAIADAGLTIISTLDHAQNAQQAGLDLRPTTVFIFGDPEAGTPLMNDNPTMALDFPQRMLVYSTGAHEVFVVWRPPSTTALDHGVDADERHRQMDSLMEELGASAAAPEGGGTAPY